MEQLLLYKNNVLQLKEEEKINIKMYVCMYTMCTNDCSVFYIDVRRFV